MAAALHDRGVQPGDVVSFQLPNSAEAVVVFHAIHRVRGVANPIVPIYREREVGFILGQAGTKVAFVPGTRRGFDHVAMYATLRQRLPELDLVVTTDGRATDGQTVGLADLIASATPEMIEAVRALPPADPDDVCLLLYTSGTTADPKGALHSHNTLVFENMSMIDTFGLNERDVVFNPSPVTHVTGVNCALTLPFLLGAPVVLQDAWDPEVALTRVLEERASFMIFATPFLRGLLDAAVARGVRTPSVRYIICGGADIPDSLVTRSTEVLGTVTRMYGATEGPSVTSANRSDEPRLRTGTDGRVLAPTEVIVSDGAGGIAATGVVGEVLWRGPDTFLGYLDASLNDEAFTADGFFRSGDLAYFDADGGIHIVGRIKDIINRSGEKISTHDVENELSEHPAVAEIAVVAGPDARTGERGCAFVVTRDAVDLTLEEVREFLSARGIAMQKVPESVFVVDSLPKTASGKIQKFALRDWTRDRNTTPPQMQAVTISAAHER
ncbi:MULTISPECIES: AMP-binding protein [unclassified Gordonia (in: high G+C Gram-positive bacteria)]|uniref:AMP-binding protein n=1 Tax=unclassified Gordonia (in: high G+C Gram-positive bacteria) TaxID=2657482 RepID=UPI001F06FFAB|nr:MULTISPECIES: AMP-binding protein [unclassified Gordonia (in: high G+C Gram-positive bacteria)]